MATKLYVGNLSFNTTENDLQDLFATVGPVTEVLLMQDRVTGKSRGFGFVTMSTDQDAASAVTQFHGKTVEGRALTVNEARPREERSGGGGGGGGRSYGGGGGGGYSGGAAAAATAVAAAAATAAVVAAGAVTAAAAATVVVARRRRPWRPFLALLILRRSLSDLHAPTVERRWEFCFVRGCVRRHARPTDGLRCKLTAASPARSMLTPHFFPVSRIVPLLAAFRRRADGRLRRAGRPVTDTLSERMPEEVFAAVLEPDARTGYNLRSDTWNGNLPAGETKPIGHQFFKGNDYHFYLTTDVKGAKVSVHIYDKDGNLAEDRAWQKQASNAFFAGSRNQSENDGRLFPDRPHRRIAGETNPVVDGLHVQIGP